MSRLLVRYPRILRGRRVVLEAGEFRAPLPAAVAVVGINGSGKTSLFMYLTDTLATSRKPTFPDAAGPVSAIAYAPQAPALPSWLRVEQAATLYGTHFDRLVDEMPGLHLHELAGRRCGALSLGQQQALGIAIALAVPARLLILDEPFSALDFRRRIGAIELLRVWRAAAPDRALLLSSQNAADLVDVCDYFVVIRDGRCVFAGERALLATDTGTALHAIEQSLLQLLA